jgi:hypothetical protein
MLVLWVYKLSASRFVSIVLTELGRGRSHLVLALLVFLHGRFRGLCHSWPDAGF